MGITEDTVNYYCSSVSNSEKTRIENAKLMIRDAIKSSGELANLDYEIFVQGSCANCTNIRVDSDIDVCVMLKSVSWSEYAYEMTSTDCGFIGTNESKYYDYKERLIHALDRKFDDIRKGNKSIKIESNSYRVNADVVITFQYRNYKIINSNNPNIYVEGTKFISSSGEIVINYPKQHIKNGESKDKDTYGNYKNLVKVFKAVKSNMEDCKKLIGSDKVSSFLIESLIWNVPNDIITAYSTLKETVKEVIKYLYYEIENNRCGGWREVSECLYLFGGNRKWTYRDVKDFLLKMYQHIGD